MDLWSIPQTWGSIYGTTIFKISTFLEDAGFLGLISLRLKKKTKGWKISVVHWDTSHLYSRPDILTSCDHLGT